MGRLMPRKKIPRENLGRALKTLRTFHGIQQKELADRLNLTPNYISLIENGARVPSWEVLCDFLDAMEVSFNAFSRALEDRLLEDR